MLLGTKPDSGVWCPHLRVLKSLSLPDESIPLPVALFQDGAYLIDRNISAVY